MRNRLCQTAILVFFIQWRTTEKHKHDSSFTFDSSFNTEYADGALKPSDKVHFTPKSSGETCEAVQTELKAEEAKLADNLDSLAEIKNKGDLKARTAILRPFQKLHMKYDKMGCENGAGPALDQGLMDKMVAKLRATYVKHAPSAFRNTDEAAAQARFDSLLGYVKENADGSTIKDAIKASGIAFGTTPEEEDVDVDVDSDLTDANAEDELDNMFVKLESTGATSLAEVHDGQVATQGQHIDDVIVAGAAIIVCVGVVVALFVLFWWIVLWIFIAAVLISLGILAVNWVQENR